MVEGPGLDEDATPCQLAVRNINIIRLAEGTDTAHYPGRGELVRRLDTAQVESVRRALGQQGRTWAALLGYDGGVKQVVAGRASLASFLARVDTMPMRRQEIRQGAVCP